MLDFTSALYLGLRHPSGSLRPWSEFTMGVPAALGSPPDSGQVAHQLAMLQGCERGVLGTSTFHLFWDLFGMLSRRQVAIYVDAGTYPIARWGVERAAARGVPASPFAHHDPHALNRRLRQVGQHGPRPLVVTDGFCPGCGNSAPLGAYLDSVRAHGGWLIVDDTQALGIFGDSPGPDAPYGRGGGGMLPRIQVSGPDVLVVSSLAKGFGAPVAALSGSRAALEYFERKSETRMHCSPPSVPVIRAAQHALGINREYGEQIRLRLAGLVKRFRDRAAHGGFRFSGGLFPVQTLAPRETDAPDLHERLLRRGVRSVLHHAPEGHGLRISFVITARHTPEAVDRAMDVLAESAKQQALKISGGANYEQRIGV